MEPYSTVRADLLADAPGDANFNSLPAGATFQGQSDVEVWDAQAKVFGLLPGNASEVDGYANFSADIETDALVGVALHELSHAMGRVPYGSPYSSSPDIFDLFRFTSPGTVLIEDTIPATQAYFSVTGGLTSLGEYGVASDPSDFLNSSVPNDPLDEIYYPGSTAQTLTPIDLTQLDVLGFTTTGGVVTPVIFAWTGASDGNFANALNWDDVTDGLDPASRPPGATDLALITNGGTITGTGTVAQLNFAGTNTVAGTLTATGSIDESSGTVAVTGLLTVGAATIDGTLAAKAGGRVIVSDSLDLDGALSADGASSVEVGTAGGAAAGLITVDATGAINGDGTLAGAVLNNGTITDAVGVAASNLLEITGALTGSGTILPQMPGPEQAGPIVQLNSSVAASQVVDFGTEYYNFGGPSVLRLLDPTQFAGVLDDFWSSHARLVLVGETITNAVVNNSTLTVSVTTGGPLTFKLAGSEPYTSELYLNGSTLTVLPLRQLSWTGAAGTDFGTAGNWYDLTNDADPAATAPGAMDEAFIESSGTIGGTGDVYGLVFAYSTNTVTAALSSVTDVDIEVATLTVTGGLSGQDLYLFSGSLLASSGASVKASVEGYLYPTYGTASELSVDSSSSVEIGTAGGATVGAITTDPGFGIYGDGTLAAQVVNNGFLYAYEESAGLNVMEITGALTGAGYVDLLDGYLSNGTVVPGAVVQLDGSVASTQTFYFSTNSNLGVESDVRLLEPSEFNGTLAGFDNTGDALELFGQTVTGASVTGSTLTVTVQGGGPFRFNLLNTPSTTILAWSGDKVTVAGVARTLEWLGSSYSSVFGVAGNWYDLTDGLEPGGIGANL